MRLWPNPHSARCTTDPPNIPRFRALALLGRLPSARADGTSCRHPRSLHRTCPERDAAEEAGVTWAVKEKAKPGRALTQRQRARNRRFGKVRAKVEHVFRVVKCQFGYRKVRYRGIAKNGAQMFALLALANLYLVRGRLAPA